MNPDLSRRVGAVMSTWTIILAPPAVHDILISGVERASSFDTLGASLRALIVLAERELAADLHDFPAYVAWANSKPENRPAYRSRSP